MQDKIEYTFGSPEENRLMQIEGLHGMLELVVMKPLRAPLRPPPPPHPFSPPQHHHVDIQPEVIHTVIAKLSDKDTTLALLAANCIWHLNVSTKSRRYAPLGTFGHFPPTASHL
eukprot:1177267-Prorocentrum_minimum.AAC.7